MKDIAIFGAGGFGREVACLIKKINEIKPTWNFIGFFDDGLPIGHLTEYGKVLGGIEVLNRYPEDLNLSIAIGSPKILAMIVKKVTNQKITFSNLIAPDTIFYDNENIKIGKGNIIGFRNVISCNVSIGDFNIFNTDVFLGHDTSIGAFNVFNPSVRISGEVNIGNENFFGVCSIVLQQKKIGCGVTVGANSLIIRKVQDNSVYIGNPAIKLQ